MIVFTKLLVLGYSQNQGCTNQQNKSKSMVATETMKAVQDIINALKDIQFNAVAMSEINRAIRFMKEETGEELVQLKTITDDLEIILKALRKFRANTIIEESEV